MSSRNAARVVRIFVSSPVDVTPERGRVQAVAAKLNRDYEGLVCFDTVLWEEHFYKADRSFQPQIPEAVACDVLVSIFWTRIGSALPVDFPRMPNGEPYPSGTAYELLTALAASKAKGVPDVYVFRKTADAVLPTADAERRRQAQTQLDALEAFWSEWFKSEQGQFKAAFQTFRSTDEFERQIELLLRQWLESHGLLGPRLRWPKEKGSPFRGLAPFEASHAAVFFGRDRMIDEARRRLLAAAENATPFLLIVGASGSGKSSLARAGLIPRLTTPGVVTAVNLWRVALMKPGEDQAGPLAALAAALFAAIPELSEGDFSNAAALTDHLRRGGEPAARPIMRALARIAAAEQRERCSDEPLQTTLLLLVDQLDELFAQAVSDEERAAFAQTIEVLVATSRIWCIATLRADLYELLLKQPVLKALKETGASLDLGPPGPAELAEIVRAPAAAAGLVFESDAKKGALDERLLADARTAESLPLLQFTLQQLYERRQEVQGETRLTHAAYEAIGGLQGAIAAEAERAVANLPLGALDALPRLLRQLAEPARDGKTLTLREVAQREVTATPLQAMLVDALVRARILIARQDARDRPTLRLAHDAVLTSWPKAQAAAQASRDFYRVRAEVEEALRRWQEHGQPKDRLIQRGVPLAEAEKLVADFGAELSGELVDYIGASHRQARLRQRLVAAAAVFFFFLAVAATGAGLWAYQERQRALSNFILARGTADSIVVDIARGLRNVEGMRTETVRRILETARATFNRLAASAPGDFTLQESRATMLDEFGTTYATLGDLAQALQADRDSLAIRERLAKAEPSNRVRQHNLAVSRGNIGDVLMAQGKLAEALKSYGDGLAIMELLARADPGDVNWQRDLAAFYERVGDVLRTQGNLSDAFTSYRNGLALREQLVKIDPANNGARSDLTVLYDRLGDVLMAQGNLPQALASYRDGLVVRAQLAETDADNAGWQRDLAVSYNKVGDVLATQGSLSDALASYRNSLAIAKHLVKIDPGNSGWQRDLSASYTKIGDLLVDQGNLPEALKSYRGGLDIWERLAEADPNNAGWQRDLAVSYGRVGDVLMAQGNLAEALNSHRNCLAMLERLAKADPGNAGWQWDVSVSYAKIGDALRAQGNLPDALASYREGLSIRKRLVEARPGNADWQRDLSVSYNRIGDVLVAQSDLAGALMSYRDGLAIIEHLVTTQPLNSGWQRDLSFSYNKVGDALAAQGDLYEALKTYRNGLAVAERLVSSDRGNRQWQEDLQFVVSRICGLGYKFVWARDFAKALEAADQAIALASDKVWFNLVRAEALMFLGRIDEARTVYLKYRGRKDVLAGKSWEATVLESFAELRKAGLTNALMDEVETQFRSAG